MTSRTLLGVPVERTLARVEEDLAAGRSVLARQRLRGLIGSLPQRLDLRERLAEVYRAEGDLAQAGRWSYLSRDRDEREVRAFERGFVGDPVRLMSALSWRGSEDDAGDEVARERLRAVRAAAEAKAGRSLAWEKPTWPRSDPRTWKSELAGAGCMVVIVAFLVLAAVGLVALAVHGLHVVVGWAG